MNINNFLLLFAFGVIVGAFLFIKQKIEKVKKEYRYDKKDFLLTPSEHKFFDALVKAVSDEYLIFPQIHLSALINHRVKGQNWKGAFSHINGKSVDFVLCDKNYISPKLAIELDDRSHELEDRQERDGIVENILKNAGVPLLRIKNQENFNPDDIKREISSFL